MSAQRAEAGKLVAVERPIAIFHLKDRISSSDLSNVISRVSDDGLVGKTVRCCAEGSGRSRCAGRQEHRDILKYFVCPSCL